MQNYLRISGAYSVTAESFEGYESLQLDQKVQHLSRVAKDFLPLLPIEEVFDDLKGFDDKYGAEIQHSTTQQCYVYVVVDQLKKLPEQQQQEFFAHVSAETLKTLGRYLSALLDKDLSNLIGPLDAQSKTFREYIEFILTMPYPRQQRSQSGTAWEALCRINQGQSSNPENVPA